MKTNIKFYVNYLFYELRKMAEIEEGIIHQKMSIPERRKHPDAFKSYEEAENFINEFIPAKNALDYEFEIEKVYEESK